ncbi:MAG: DUF3618 domain-containing protein [Actinomycetaceae bacterium]|nr:DUF3618 domain-containing protein [Actinomycetaceae bacterium]
MSNTPRTVEEIEAEIQRTRLAMQSTVNELSGRLDPRTQAKAAADTAVESATEFGHGVVDNFKAALKGDPRALAQVASAGVVVGLLAGIAKLRK